MASILSLILMVSAALGAGGWLLKATRTLHGFSEFERIIVSFALGIGAVGWTIFFLALGKEISQTALIAGLSILSLGVYFIIPLAKTGWMIEKPDGGRAALLIAIALVLIYDVLEGVAPPTDADSLAYHFAIPKAILDQGGLFPIYQAIEGTIPLLQQMTYLAALGLGGEQSMTLWTMLSGWSATALIFVLAHRYVSTNWALAIALVFLSTPAVLYGAGSGQIEVRSASFVLVSTFAIVEARRTQLLRYAILAGIVAGFFVASKYTGLIFAFSAGFLLLFQRRWFAHGAAFSTALILTGVQWYGWNFWTTGDPIFPLLYGKIDYLSTVPWNENIHNAYRSAIEDKSVSTDLIGYLYYPIKATLFAEPAFESLRVGFGPVVLLLLPFAFLAVWENRVKLRNHPLTVFGAVCLVAYTIWFFIGPSQRVRHLLPIYPLLLLCTSIAAIRVAQSHLNLTRGLILIFAFVILLQISGATIYASNYIQFAFSNESRDAFLKQTLSQYGAADAANKHLTANDTVLVSTRQIVYYLNSHVFYANIGQQAVVELHEKAADPRVLWKQLQTKNISHILVPFTLQPTESSHSYSIMLQDLRDKKCLKIIEEFETLSITSRTLKALGNSHSKFSLAQLHPRSCLYNLS